MRNKILQAALDGVPFALHEKSMSALLSMANSEIPRAEQQTPKVANNSVVYETRGNAAIISIDGGMYKKNIGGLCSAVASYDQMVKAIDKAEADENITTILFRVDSPGGAVAGVDEVEEKIYKSKKRTITLFENLGASGAIWAFMASDEVYATQTTQLGSIGVVVSYLKDEDEDKRVEIVSKNAKNKRCNLNGDCKEKISSMIDTYEEIFYERVMKNTGFDEEKIKTVFNDGDIIFSTKAYEEGFIQGVKTFDEVLKSILTTTAATDALAPSVKTVNKTTGVTMEFDRDNLDATEQVFNALVLNRDTLTARQEKLSLDLQNKTVALETLQAEHEALQTEVAGARNRLDDVETRLLEAISEGVVVKPALTMVLAEDSSTASKIALETKQSQGQTMQHKQESNESGLLAYAQKHKGSIR